MNTEKQTQTQDSIYDMLGGADAVRRLVDRFYDLMDADPRYGGIRALHPPTLAGSREKLYLFLSGWLGGSQLYVARHGHPRLRARARHLPFAIGIPERDAWLACMKQAMADVGVAPELQAHLAEAFFGTADFMRNRLG